MRPLFRSPKFADGMTSEAIEESGLKDLHIRNGAEAAGWCAPLRISTGRCERTERHINTQTGQHDGKYLEYIPTLFSDVDLYAIWWPFRYQQFGHVCAERITSAV